MRGIQPARRPPSPLDAEFATELQCRWPSALGFPTMASTAPACPGPSAAVRRLSGIISSNDGLLAASSFGTLVVNDPLRPSEPLRAAIQETPWPRRGQYPAAGLDGLGRIGGVEGYSRLSDSRRLR